MVRALLLSVLAQAAPPPPYVGTRPVPHERPFEVKPGTVDFELPFTENWFEDYAPAGSAHLKPPRNPAAIREALSRWTIPVRLYYPPAVEPGRRYGLYIVHGPWGQEDSRVDAYLPTRHAHNAGLVVAGFWLKPEIQECGFVPYPSVGVYLASTLARWGSVDPNRIYVGGFSGGAKAANHCLFQFPWDYAGVMMLGCNQFWTVKHQKTLPLVAKARGWAVFVGTGKLDTTAPPVASAAVFREFQALGVPYAAMWDHEKEHGPNQDQFERAFRLFNESYADWHARTEESSFRTGVEHARAKRYGKALLPLLKVASFKPDSGRAREAAAYLEEIEKDLAFVNEKAAMFAEGKKTEAARSALKDAAGRYKGSWHEFELQARARALKGP